MMKIWQIIIDGENSVVNPVIDPETGVQMVGDENTAVELNDMIPELFGWNGHVIIRYRASQTKPQINLWAPFDSWGEEGIMARQARIHDQW